MARLSLRCAVALAALSVLPAQPPPTAVDLSLWSDNTVLIDPLLVEASQDDEYYDATGMGAQEAEWD